MLNSVELIALWKTKRPYCARQILADLCEKQVLSFEMPFYCRALRVVKMEGKLQDGSTVWFDANPLNSLWPEHFPWRSLKCSAISNKTVQIFACVVNNYKANASSKTSSLFKWMTNWKHPSNGCSKKVIHVITDVTLGYSQIRNDTSDKLHHSACRKRSKK